jgi:very-short-patch-repair endonuclease
LTALDLCATLGGDPIDHALRSRMTTLARLHEAFELCGGRRANRLRQQLLLDSRTEPWSGAERKAHRALPGAGISAWHANRPVVVRGHTFFPDIGFEALKLDVEIDGREHHIGPEVFETDRWRQNLFVLDGWMVLRFTWTMLDEGPNDLLDQIREAMEQRRGFSTPRSLTRWARLPTLPSEPWVDEASTA